MSTRHFVFAPVKVTLAQLMFGGAKCLRAMNLSQTGSAVLHIIAINQSWLLTNDALLIASCFNRHQFYLNLRKDFQEGRLRIQDETVAYRLAALIAQSELGNFDAASDSSSALILSYIKFLPSCLVEHGEPSICSPLATRKTLGTKRRKHHSGASDSDTSDHEQEPPSSPCEHDYNQAARKFAPSPPPTPCDRCAADKDLPQRLGSAVMQVHKELKDVKPSAARYLFLKEVSNLEDFGVDYFIVKSNSSPEELFYLGIGPKGVTVTSHEDALKVKHR